MSSGRGTSSGLCREPVEGVSRKQSFLAALKGGPHVEAIAELALCQGRSGEDGRRNWAGGGWGSGWRVRFGFTFGGSGAPLRLARAGGAVTKGGVAGPIPPHKGSRLQLTAPNKKREGKEVPNAQLDWVGEGVFRR